MNYFIEFLDTIKNTVFLSDSDSDEDRAKKILWYTFFGSIIMICIISYIIFVAFSFSGKGVKVPHIEGDNIYVGLRKIGDKDLSVRVSPRYSDTSPEGIIMSQSPSQGSYVRPGRKIAISVSIGQKENSLPDFTQMTLFDIAILLDELYPNGDIPYKIDEKIYEFSEKIEKGRIIKQEPAEGTPVKSCRSVKVWISNGMETMASKTVGTYGNEKLYKALKDIALKEINVSVQFTETSKRNEHYMVTSQSVDPGVLAEDLIKQDDVLILSSMIFIDNKNDYVKGDFVVELPKSNLPYTLSIVKEEQGEASEEIFAMTTKGGFSFTLPYSVKKYIKLRAKMNDKDLKEFQVE